MQARLDRRAARARERQRIAFLDPDSPIEGTAILVRDARAGAFEGGEIPHDLRRQWIQGTGPAARPGTPVERSLRNVAYALLSGADGWMFDGEDALGQVSSMSLDNQRNLALAIGRDPLFLRVAERGGRRDERLGGGLPRPARRLPTGARSSTSPRASSAPAACISTIGTSAARGAPGSPRRSSTRRSTSPTTTRRCARAGASIVLYLPKIQTAGEAAFWHRLLSALEAHLGLPNGARPHLRPRRADRGVLPVDGDSRRAGAALRRLQHRPLGLHQQRVGRDGVGSGFINPNIDAVTMTYGYMRAYEDRVRRAVNTPDRLGRTRALAGRHGAQHPGRLAGGRRSGHGARRRRRAARAARRRERQVGRALEDGAHRPAGVGAGRRGQPARTRVPAARPTRPRTPTR